MTEEVNLETGNQEAPQFTEIEQRAMEMGWRPKDHYDGNEADFVDAKEFVQRQPLFDKISHQNREIKEVRKALEALKTHYTTVRETEYERALASLKQARKTALSEGDGDRFEEVDAEIKVVEKQVDAMKAIKEAPITQETPQQEEFVTWKNQNRWYESKQELREFADALGTGLAQKGVAPAEVLKRVTAAVKKQWPDEFVNPNKSNATPTHSGASGSGGRGTSIEGQLTEQERSIMNTLVRSGTITKEKYLADLKAVKERS